MINAIISSPWFALSGWLIGAVSLFLAIRKGAECKRLKGEITTLKNSQNEYSQTVSGTVSEKSTVVNQARDINIDNR